MQWFGLHFSFSLCLMCLSLVLGEHPCWFVRTPGLDSSNVPFISWQYCCLTYLLDVLTKSSQWLIQCSIFFFFTINSRCLVFLWMVKLLQNAPSYLSNAVNGKKNSSVVPRGHQLMPWSRRFHYPYFFPLGYMTASVICSHKIFQLKFEAQSTLFVSVAFLRLQIPLLCYALDTAISF